MLQGEMSENCLLCGVASDFYTYAAELINPHKHYVMITNSHTSKETPKNNCRFIRYIT